MSGKADLKTKLHNVNVINMMAHLKMVKMAYFICMCFLAKIKKKLNIRKHNFKVKTKTKIPKL